MALSRTLVAAAALAAAALVATSASASTVLYSNGPINGEVNAWTINYGYSVTDSFTLTKAATVTGADFGAWDYDDSITSVDWSISSTPFGGSPVSAGTTDTYLFAGLYGYSIYSDNFSTGSVHLAAGTYYLTLRGASTANGYPAYWDQNSGPSTAYDSSQVPPIPSETFDILGTTSAIPEPATWAMMLVGFGGLGGMLRSRPRLATAFRPT